MTGLDPLHDRIMEVGAIATNWDLVEQGVYEAVQQVDADVVQTRMVGEFWETYSTVRDALQAQNSHGKSPQEVEDGLLAFIDANFDPTSRVILAGNSIHQDRKFIDSEWPRLAARLHYRMLDVTSWKVVMEGRYKKKFAKPESHRAIEDIRGSIEELQYYLKKVKA